MLSELLLKADKFLSNITFSSDYVLKIIQKLDSEKAWPSIWMLKIRGVDMKTPQIMFKKRDFYSIFS